MDSEQIRQCISEIQEALNSIAEKNGVTVDQLYREISDYLVIRPEAAKPSRLHKPINTDNLVWNDGEQFDPHESAVIKLRRGKA